MDGIVGTSRRARRLLLGCVLVPACLAVVPAAQADVSGTPDCDGVVVLHPDGTTTCETLNNTDPYGKG